MNIYLMRHGKKGIGSEMPLAPSGVREVEESAHKLGELGVGTVLPGIILTSPIERAAETARITGEILKIPVFDCKELHEWGFSRDHVPGLALKLVALAKDNQPDLDAAASIIAVTHEPLIIDQLGLEEADTGRFYELPMAQDQQRAA